mmetsp:Transcript_3018/g.5338  ORF Transcript_3018/g.5338 Transcript_3018/m.5338 type:complete len:301 (+) Transcript_3018:671-1573(+)
MGMIVICGGPCSSKSRVAESIRDRLVSVCSVEQKDFKVEIVDEGFGLVSRVEAYRSSHTEKQTRARLKAAVERHLNSSSLVICDGMNYIKGFRYELYCLARAANVPSCVVFCNSSVESSVVLNDARMRAGEDSYESTFINALYSRIEVPIGTNRWDRPLFEIDTSSTSFDGNETYETVLNSIVSAVLHPTQLTRKHHSTVKTRVGDANALGSLDYATREVENAILERLIDTHVGGTIPISGSEISVLLGKQVTPADLRSIRRAYLKMVRMQNAQSNGTTQSMQILTQQYIEHINRMLSPV